MNTDFHSKLKTAANGKTVVPQDWMPTGRIRPLMLDDPGEVWLQSHGQAHDLVPDLPSPYSFFGFIIEKAEQFKEQWIRKNAKGARRVCEESYHVRYVDKLRKTMELMLIEKVPVIVQPALWWAPARIYGVPDLIAHTSWLEDHFPDSFKELLAPGASGGVPDGYVVFEIRFRRGADKAGLKPIAAQIRLNTYILGHLQGWMPSRGFLITRDAIAQPAPIEIKSKLAQPLDADLRAKRDQFLEVKLHGDTLVPWRDDKAQVNIGESSERWQSAKALIAWEKTPGGDPRVLPRIGSTQKRELADKGFGSVDAMLQADPTGIPLEALSKIGPTRAAQIRAVLQANRSGIPVLPKPEAIPAKKEFEFFVDYEFFSNLNVAFKKEWPRLVGREMLFMIGVGWEEQGKWKFQAFVAKKESLEHEKDMIEAFVQFLDTKTNGAFTDADKTALYHWTNAEKSQSSRAARRLGLPDGHPLRKLPWADLQKEFMKTPCGMPGGWDYGLKGVAKSLGKLDAAYDPQWVGDLDDGLGAMVLGWKAYETKNPTTSDEMKILRQYLQADCKALWCILRWMRAGEPGATFGTPGQDYAGWDSVKKGFSRPSVEEKFVRYNGGEGVKVYQQPILGKRKTTGIKKIEHLIWGDSLRVLETQGDWRKIYSRGTVGWLHSKFIQDERLLEVNFVDVGQGDGCFIITPDGEYLLIDAGVEDHMYRFLRWRFRHFKEPITFDAAIITHPDKDHYYGFRKFFDQKDKAVENVHFRCLYHNGITERKSKDLGASATSADGKRYLTEIVTERSTLKQILGAIKGGDFLKVVRAADQCGRVDDIRMLSAGKTEPKYLSGYEKDKDVSIQVLAPVPEGAAGELRLRWFDNDAGKTKNGHSIVLRLVYKKGHKKGVSILLGGDLNIPAEEYLLGHYSGIDKPFEDANEVEKEAMIEKAKEFFGADIAKSCHHGSADVSSEFLQAVDALATVVSSGDNESHCHPRPESLGVLGKHGRGARPLIYSTELARSAEEKIKHPALVWQRLKEAREKDRETEFIEELLSELGRSVARYGMITLRTDGKNVVIAQKLEKPRSKYQKWDLTLLSPGKDGRLHYKSEHAD